MGRLLHSRLSLRSVKSHRHIYCFAGLMMIRPTAFFLIDSKSMSIEISEPDMNISIWSS